MYVIKVLKNSALSLNFRKMWLVGKSFDFCFSIAFQTKDLQRFLRSFSCKCSMRTLQRRINRTKHRWMQFGSCYIKMLITLQGKIVDHHSKAYLKERILQNEGKIWQGAYCKNDHQHFCFDCRNDSHVLRSSNTSWNNKTYPRHPNSISNVFKWIRILFLWHKVKQGDQNANCTKLYQKRPMEYSWAKKMKIKRNKLKSLPPLRPPIAYSCWKWRNNRNATRSLPGGSTTAPITPTR